MSNAPSSRSPVVGEEKVRLVTGWVSALCFRHSFNTIVDFEKAFDGVPREVIRWAMRKLGVEEWLVSAVMSMYTGAKTDVRTVYWLGGWKGHSAHKKSVPA